MIHKIQKTILRKLWERKYLRYSDLAREYYPFENVYYHIKELLKEGFITKTEGGQYRLTTKGAKQVSKFSGKSLKDIEFKIPLIVLVIQYKNDVILREYNKDDPGRFIFYGLPTFKAVSGEDTYKLVQNYIEKEFSIDGKINYLCTEQYMEYTKSGELLFDDILLCFKIKSKSKPALSKPYVWENTDSLKNREDLHTSIVDFVISKPEKFKVRKIYEDYIV